MKRGAKRKSRLPTPAERREAERYRDRCEDLISEAESLPDAATDFAFGAVELLRSLSETAERIERVTDPMRDSLENVEGGIAAWDR